MGVNAAPEAIIGALKAEREYFVTAGRADRVASIDAALKAAGHKPAARAVETTTATVAVESATPKRPRASRARRS